MAQNNFNWIAAAEHIFTALEEQCIVLQEEKEAKIRKCLNEMDSSQAKLHDVQVFYIHLKTILSKGAHQWECPK